MSLSLPPTTHVHQPLLKDGPGSAPLPEQIEDLLQDRKLLVGRCQLRIKSLDAASLCGNTGGDRLQDLRKPDFRGTGWPCRAGSAGNRPGTVPTGRVRLNHRKGRWTSDVPGVYPPYLARTCRRIGAAPQPRGSGGDSAQGQHRFSTGPETTGNNRHQLGIQDTRTGARLDVGRPASRHNRPEKPQVSAPLPALASCRASTKRWIWLVPS